MLETNAAVLQTSADSSVIYLHIHEERFSLSIFCGVFFVSYASVVAGGRVIGFL